MRIWTYAEALAKVQRDTDTEEETFIDDQEWIDYFNEAIDEAEAEIHRIYQKYFKKTYDVPLVAGTQRYVMPTDIYANKMILLYFDEGTGGRQYKVERIKEKDIARIDNNASEYLSYDIENTDATTGVELVFYPLAAVPTSSTALRMYYIRNANRIPDLDSVTSAVLNATRIDIPEFANFIFDFVKVRVAEKENHPLMPKFEANLEKQRLLMKQTLDQMVPDEDETIDPDLSFYHEFGYHYWY